MALTEEQAHAVELFKGSQSLKISAFAGTGKTTTLIELAKSTKNSGLYLAFNKAIAAEAGSRFPRTVDCRTTHSIAYRAAPNAFRRNPGKLTEGIQGNRIAQTLGLEELAVGGVVLKARSLGFMVVRTVQRFCQSGDSTIDTRHVPLVGKLEQLSDEHQDEFKRYVSELAAVIWSRMATPDDAVPLGHDGYLKLWSLSRPTLEYDFILLDEAQDTNEAVLSVLRAQDCHLTLVGDRHQQIYEWRGAINAMERVPTDAESFLTQSFRFGPEVARAATDILRLLKEPRSVIGNPDRSSVIQTSGSADAVLCRTNAGVISVVLNTLKANQRPHVVGGVTELNRLLEDVTRLKTGYPAESPELFGFQDWSEVVDFATSEEGQSLNSFVTIVSENGEAKLLEALRKVAQSEQSADLTVSTGHKAKGREWDTVRLHSDFEPKKFNPNDPAKLIMNEEEIRLLYVAATRPRLGLIAPSRLARFWGLEVAPEEAEKPKAKTIPVSPIVAVKPALPTPRIPNGARVVKNSSPVVHTSEVERPQPMPVQTPQPSRTSKATASTAAAGGIIGAIIGFLLG
jgi:hypothetical protein